MRSLLALLLRSAPLALPVVAFGCGKGAPSGHDVPATSASSKPAAAASSAAAASCPDGMAQLPAGRFLRGSTQGPDGGLGLLDERPPKEVEVQTFCLDKTEVTVGAYTTCVTAGRCEKPLEKSPPHVWTEQFTWGKPDREKHPVNGVTFESARGFCKQAGKRLPTETEWEYAARGSTNRPHPWGDAPPGPKLLNVCDTSCRAEGQKHKLAWVAMFEESDGFPYTAPVGSFPAGATPEGVLDLEGNVREWVEGPACPYDKPDCSEKAILQRGASWLEQFKGEVRSSARPRTLSNGAYASVGFRCAK